MTIENTDETENFITDTTDVVEEPKEEQEPVTADEAPTEDASKEEPEEAESTEESKEEAPEEEADAKHSEDTTAEPKKNRVQKRIDKIVREREQERREKEELKAKLEELEKKVAPKTEEPKEEDFDSYDDYLEALDKYDKGENTQEQKQEPQESKGNEAPSLTPDQETAIAVIREKVDVADKPEDFEKVSMDPTVPVTGDMLEAIAECDDPVKVMYWLGKNKDAAGKIASGTRVQQMREIAKLDLTAKITPPKPKKITSAPDPIEPVKGSDVQDKPVSEMSFSEYEAFMNKQERTRSTW